MIYVMYGVPKVEQTTRKAKDMHLILCKGD